MDDATPGIEAEAPLPVAPRKKMLRRDRFAMWFISLLFLSVFALVCIPGGPPELDLRDEVMEDRHGSVEHGWPWPFWVQRLSEEDMQPLLDEMHEDFDGSGVLDLFFGSSRPAWQTAEGWRFSGKNITIELLPWGIAGDLLAVVAALALIRFCCAWRVRQRGSLFRYSLRDLGVVMIALAVALGWWRQAMSTQEQELAAANARLPGVAIYRQYRGPKWLARLVGERALPFWRVTVMQHDSTPNGHPNAETSASPRFDSFSELKIIALTDSPVIAELCLEALKVEGLEALQCLSFPELNDESLGAIDECELVALNFGGPPKSRTQVEAISRFRTVRRLQFTWAPTSPDGALEQIAKMPCLESLHFVVEYDYGQGATYRFGSEEPRARHRPAPDLRPLGSCRTLRRLTLDRIAIDDACIDALRELADVTHVKFLRCKAPRSSMERLQAVRPDLLIEEEHTFAP